MVVRLPPLEQTFPDYDLAPQALVQNTVAAAGVPAPAPAVVVDDPAWIGSPFLVMPRVVRRIPGPAPVFDPYVRDGGPALQRIMHDGLVDTVAAIHAVPWAAAGLDAALSGPELRDALDRWSAYVEWAAEGDPLPPLAQALDWCTRPRAARTRAGAALGRRPPGQSRLRRGARGGGGARLGSRLARAARDGPRLALRTRLHDGGVVRARGAGVPGPVETLERYERATGHAVHDLAWHEVFALVRALAINDRHQRITADPRRRDNPMGASSGAPGGGRVGRIAGRCRRDDPGGRSGGRPESTTCRRASVRPAHVGRVEQREAHHARLGHFVTECVVRLDEAVGDLALARDAAVVLVLAGQPAAHGGVVDVEGLGVHDDLVALRHRHAVPEVTVGRPAVGAAVHAAAEERDLVAESLEGHRLDRAVDEDEIDLAALQQMGVRLEAHAVHAPRQRRTALARIADVVEDMVAPDAEVGELDPLAAVRVLHAHVAARAAHAVAGPPVVVARPEVRVALRA